MCEARIDRCNLDVDRHPFYQRSHNSVVDPPERLAKAKLRFVRDSHQVRVCRVSLFMCRRVPCGTVLLITHTTIAAAFYSEPHQFRPLWCVSQDSNIFIHVGICQKRTKSNSSCCAAYQRTTPMSGTLRFLPRNQFRQETAKM